LIEVRSEMPNDPEIPGNDECRAVRVRVGGIVQGVGFRYFTHRIAVSLGLDGYVRNMSDGSVEAVAEGNAQMVDLFLDKIGRGPAASSVRSLKVSEIPPVGYNGFDIRL
jgi:acylphosphatase